MSRATGKLRGRVRILEAENKRLKREIQSILSRAVILMDRIYKVKSVAGRSEFELTRATVEVQGNTITATAF